MSARVERTVPARKIKAEQKIVNFDAERLKAPFLLRCGALLIDYILLISIPVVSLLLNKFFGDPTKVLNSAISNAGWLITVLVALTNFIIFPLFSGQSVGKMLTGLKIVQTDGSAPGLGRLLLRHIVGYTLTALTLGLGFLFAVVSPQGRALHDLLTGTVVVYGRKRVEKKDA
jgi:uncharacterized RDD family membrane protein YckC